MTELPGDLPGHADAQRSMRGCKEQQMSQQQSEPNKGGNENPSETTPGAGGEFEAITSQEEFDRRVGDRVKRERAKFADYKDVKAKADRLDELEAANKSEIEKAGEKAATAERERDAARAEVLRYRVAAQHEITDPDDIELFLTGTDEETLTKQAKRLADRESARRKGGNVSPNEGRAPNNTSGSDDERAAVRGLFGSG